MTKDIFHFDKVHLSIDGVTHFIDFDTGDKMPSIPELAEAFQLGLFDTYHDTNFSIF